MSRTVYTKLCAARSQLYTAIYLYIHNKDPASICTLSEAAAGISRDLLKKEGKKYFNCMFDVIDSKKLVEIFDKKQNFFSECIYKHRNWLKHSKNDKINDKIIINDDHVRLLLLSAIHDFCLLTDDVSDICAAFIDWMALHDPILFVDKTFVNSERLAGLNYLLNDRKSFFDHMAPLFMKNM